MQQTPNAIGVLTFVSALSWLPVPKAPRILRTVIRFDQLSVLVGGTMEKGATEAHYYQKDSIEDLKGRLGNTRGGTGRHSVGM
jgi:hypothetical protein